MLVVDSSAALDAIIGIGTPSGLVQRLTDDGDLHAPHLIDIEVLNALRRLSSQGELSDDRATDALADFRELAIVRYPHIGLSDRIWQLRHNLTAYDAAFVALAEALDVPLITCDHGISQAPGHSATVEVFSAGS